MLVVNENGSGTGSRWFCKIYLPAVRCHHMSESPASPENRQSRYSAVNARMRGRTQGGVARTGWTGTGVDGDAIREGIAEPSILSTEGSADLRLMAYGGATRRR